MPGSQALCWAYWGGRDLEISVPVFRGLAQPSGETQYICEMMSNNTKSEVVHTGGQRRKDGFCGRSGGRGGGVLEGRRGQRLI